MKKSFVWDLPVRLFHWSLVILVCVSLYTGFDGGFFIFDYHLLSGYAILALVAFRLLWGLIGSRNARFTTFIRGPKAIADYTRSLGKGYRSYIGHSPLGALSVVAILLALVVQVGTGLFASNEDLMVDSPLTHLVSTGTSRELTWIHEINVWVIIALVCLHLLAIAWYRLVRGDNLVLPMITGWKQLPEEVDAERNNWLLALVLLGAVSGGVYYLVKYV